MGISRTTAYRWWARYQQLGQAGLVDRPSIPTHSPRRTAAPLEQRILRLRRRERLGPARIAARLGVPASTVHRVLVRHRMNRLAWLDRPSGRPIRRYEHPWPGDLVHLDVITGAIKWGDVDFAFRQLRRLSGHTPWRPP
jgi:hypothetical protein